MPHLLLNSIYPKIKPLQSIFLIGKIVVQIETLIFMDLPSVNDCVITIWVELYLRFVFAE